MLLLIKDADARETNATNAANATDENVANDFKSQKQLREFLETKYEELASTAKHAEAIAQYDLETDVDNPEKKAEQVRNETKYVFVLFVKQICVAAKRHFGRLEFHEDVLEEYFSVFETGRLQRSSSQETAEIFETSRRRRARTGRNRRGICRLFFFCFR